MPIRLDNKFSIRPCRISGIMISGPPNYMSSPFSFKSNRYYKWLQNRIQKYIIHNAFNNAKKIDFVTMTAPLLVNLLSAKATFSQAV